MNTATAAARLPMPTVTAPICRIRCAGDIEDDGPFTIDDVLRMISIEFGVARKLTDQAQLV